MSDEGQMTKLLGRFRELAEAVPVWRPTRRPAARPMPTPAEILHAALHQWAKGAPEEFRPWLRENLEAALSNADSQRASHAESSYWLGYAAALRGVRTQFTNWSADSPPTADVGAEPQT